MKPSAYLTVLLASFIMTQSINAEELPHIPLWAKEVTPYAKGESDIDQPFVDVYLPDEKKRNGAAVIVCPGGGYGGLALDHEGHQIGQFYNSFGVTAFVLHYRLGSHQYHFPTQLADVQRAIRYARSQSSQYHLDPKRIGVMGFSAGGHLASMAATKFDEKAYPASDTIDQVSARPDFAVLCYPVISMNSEFTHKGSRKNLLGEEKLKNPKAIDHVSSDLNITDQTPPTFLFHTNEDTAVPPENSIRFYLGLRQHQIPAELHLYQKGPHGVGLQKGDPILGTWGGHLQDWLRSNGFLSPANSPKRVAVSGKVSLNGTPVSWGSITFTPDDPNLPLTSTVVRGGKFRTSVKNGPNVAPSRVSFEASIWEATHDSKDRVIQVDRLSQSDPQPLSIDIADGMKPLQFDLISR